MPDETPPESSPETPPQSESERVAHDVQSGLETAGQVAEGVGQAAEQVQGFIAGEGGSPTVPGALQGASGAVGGAGQLLGGLGVNDAGVSAAIGVAQQALSLASTVYSAGEQIVEAVEAIIHAEARIEEVRFTFEVLDQPRDWEIHDLEVIESLTGIYVARIELCTENLRADPNALLGQSVSLTMSRKELEHPIRGIVRRVEHGLSTDRAVVARIEVVPAVAMLGYGQDTRIFQNLTVPEILDEVLGLGLQPYDRTIEARLGYREYPPREYCTQREESDWHFALRLMQEEGIACFFEHTDKREVLVLADSYAVYETVPTLDGRDGIRFIPSENVFDAIEPIRDLVEAQQLTTTSVAVSDHDWSRVAQTFLQEDKADQHGNREHYASSQPLTAYDFDPSRIAFGRNDLRDQVEIRGELLRRDRQLVRGRGVVSGMAPGLCFVLKGHPSGSLNQEYLLTEVRHTARNHAVAHLFDGDEARAYENTFVAMPRSRQYRPERTLKRPRIAGMESAVVVGPTAESEIHTDDFRRVKVQFRWDRLHKFDAFSSCYLRVMQAWAGNGFGVDFLPRVGMEVVVSYLGGDPDRPFIAGCLYNQNNRPPYSAPGDDTKSVIRTLTSPADGDKFNELRFDDKKNGEEIFVHASRDLNEVVEHCHTTRVKVNQSNTVNGNQTETIDKDQSLLVKGERSATVEMNETIDILKSQKIHVGSDHELCVDQNQRLVTEGTRHVFVGKKDNETFNAGREIVVKAFDNLHVEGANQNTHVDGQCNIVADEHFKVTQSGETICLKNCVFIESSVQAQLKAPGVTLAMIGGRAVLSAESAIFFEVGGSRISITAAGIHVSGTAVTLDGGGSTASLSATGASVSGAGTTQITASGILTIQGTVVSIN